MENVISEIDFERDLDGWGAKLEEIERRAARGDGEGSSSSSSDNKKSSSSSDNKNSNGGVKMEIESSEGNSITLGGNNNSASAGVNYNDKEREPPKKKPSLRNPSKYLIKNLKLLGLGREHLRGIATDDGFIIGAGGMRRSMGGGRLGLPSPGGMGGKKEDSGSGELATMVSMDEIVSDEKIKLEDILPADSRTMVALNQLNGPAFNQVLSIVKDDKKVKLCMMLCERIYALRYDVQQEVFPKIPLCINQIQVRSGGGNMRLHTDIVLKKEYMPM